MTQQEQVASFNQSIRLSLDRNTFVKLSLGNYKGDIAELKNMYMKRILIKDQTMLSVTYRYKTKDIVKNFGIEQGLLMVEDAEGDFRVATLMTTENDLQMEYFSEKKIVFRTLKATHTTLPEETHDKNKKRHIGTGKNTYLHDLKITNAEGVVLKHAQDKYRQINHYIELLSTMLKDLPSREELHVLDMGSGKGYLTFALYDYLNNNLQRKATVTGVEYRQDMVQLCTEVAAKNNFQDLHFAKGSIGDYDCKDVNILIALHACDTATDDAIYKGITANADLIVVAPCCHKQIRKEMETSNIQNDLDFMVKYGIYLEREAEMVTDSLRALLLEYAGYKTRVFEFISGEHTPKNVMIVGERRSAAEKVNKALYVERIKKAKAYFGIRQHHLEMKLGL